MTSNGRGPRRRPSVRQVESELGMEGCVVYCTPPRRAMKHMGLIKFKLTK